MTSDDVKTVLRTHPFFAALTDDEVTAVAGCGQGVEFLPGQALLREGEDATRFYVLWRGKVAVQTYVPGRGIVTLQTLHGGEVLGWSWSSPPSTWSFDASAQEPTRAVQLSGPALLRLCEAWPPLGFKLMKGLLGVVSERLRSTRLQLLDLYAPPRDAGLLPELRRGSGT
jgi:CRP-like cAMP-binding protein